MSVDVFYIWGFPFETLEDFHQSLFQMVSFRMMGAWILPSLLSLLPQTEIYREWVFCMPITSEPNCNSVHTDSFQKKMF